MSEYRRAYQPGGCYFFTVVTFGRRPLFEEMENLARLKAAFRAVMSKRPFEIDAIVVLPDHLHCIWHLPSGDADFATRWRLIKRYVSTGIAAASNSRNEKAVWQRRYWEQ